MQSSGTTQFPLLKKVLVAFGDQVGFADTLDQALDQVFGGNSGASAGDVDNRSAADGGSSDSSQAKDNQQGGGSSGSSSQPSSGVTQSEALKSALADAAQAMKDSDAAMKSGDWTAYGQAQKKLEDAINKALAEENKASATK